MDSSTGTQDVGPIHKNTAPRVITNAMLGIPYENCSMIFPQNPIKITKALLVRRVRVLIRNMS